VTPGRPTNLPSSWTNPDPDYDSESDDLKPRKLTDSEIEYILNQIPVGFGADVNSNELAREQVCDKLRNELKQIEVCPDGIYDLLVKLIDLYVGSMIVPGTMIGCSSAEALGAATTQMTLNSVAPWEEIIFQDGDKTILTEIGPYIDGIIDKSHNVQLIPENRTELVELARPVKIASVDKQGNAVWSDLTHVMRHDPVGNLLTFTLRSGREVTVTRQKSMLTYRDGEIVPVDGADLRVGDKVPVTLNFPTGPEGPVTYDSFDLRTVFSPKKVIFTNEMIKLKAAYDQWKTNPGSIKKFWTAEKLVNVPYNRGDSFLLACQHPYLLIPNLVFPKSHGGSENSRIPDKIPLDHHTGQFLGIFLADGCCSDTFVNVTKNEPAIRAIVSSWCDRFGITYRHIERTLSRQTQSSMCITVHSVLFARWLKMWTGTGSADKIIPPEILMGNQDFVRGFLDGYIAGDGCISRGDGSINVGSVSKAIIYGVSFLCSRFGIFGKISGVQQKKNNIGSKNILYMHTFRISNGFAQIFARKIGSCNPQKQEKLETITLKKKYRHPIGRHYQQVKDVLLDDIVSIKEVEYSGKVYDVTVPATLTFCEYTSMPQADSFHSSGSAKSATSGIDRMRDLIFARQTPKNETYSLFFSNPFLSYQDVMDLKPDLIGSLFSDFIQTYDILDVVDLEVPAWYPVAQLILKVTVPETATKVLRLNLNKTELYRQKVTIAMLADKLMSGDKNRGNQTIVCLYGSIADGIMDIYATPDFTLNCQKDADLKDYQIQGDLGLAEMLFLETCLVPDLKNIRIKGVSGISNLTPIVKKTVDLIKTVKENDHSDPIVDKKLALSVQQDAGREFQEICYLAYFNQDLIRTTGITPGNFARLCNEVNIWIFYQTEAFAALRLPITAQQKPLEYINGKVAEEKKRLHDELKTLIEEQSRTGPIDIVSLPPTPLITASEYLLAEAEIKTKSSLTVENENFNRNYKRLLGLPFVDKTRTYCNNMHIIAQTLGIEAARNFFINELTQTLSDNFLYVHPVHIAFIAEFVMNRGRPFGATFTGISRQGNGHLALATLQRAANVIVESAIFGKNEDIRAVSSSIVVGNRAVVGTGAVDVALDIQVRNPQTGKIETKTVLNEQIYKAFQQDLEEQARLDKVRAEDESGFFSRINPNSEYSFVQREMLDDVEGDDKVGIDLFDEDTIFDPLKTVAVANTVDVNSLDVNQPPSTLRGSTGATSLISDILSRINRSRQEAEKEPEAKEPEAKEPEAKEPEAKEPEAKVNRPIRRPVRTVGKTDLGKLTDVLQ